MITLLGEPEDADLLWLAAALRRSGQATDIVLPDEIVDGATLACRLDGSAVSSSLRLHDGRTLGGGTPLLVVNRLTQVAGRPTSSAVDTAYLREEWRAAVVAWLRTLSCPVLNPPRAAALSGPVMPVPAWLNVARFVGLQTQAWTSDDHAVVNDAVDVFVVGDACLDATHSAPSGVLERLRQMSRLLGAPLMSARFDRADEWRFAGATTFPALAEGGAPLVQRIIELAEPTSSAS